MKKLSKILLGTAAAAAALKGLDNRLEITHYNLSFTGLPPEFDNFKIALFSDIHCDCTAGLAEAVKGENPDIICIPGDMTHDDVPYEPFIHLLEKLVKIAPVYMCSGNHDVWRSDYVKFSSVCRDSGAYLLSDENEFIERDGAKIRIAGIEDPSAGLTKTALGRCEKSFSRLETGDSFGILLFHRANYFDYICDKGFDLVLAGHMHGGLMRIPILGGFVCPKTNLISETGTFFPKYFGGEYEKNGTKMIVTRGIGNTSFIPRFYNRPELCTITLKASVSET